MEFIAVTIAAVFLGTLVEYVVHRLMHWGILYPQGHRWHHESNEARTYVRDVIDYGGGAVPFCWVGFLVSPATGFGLLAGILIYALMAAYAHQLQHAHSHLVFWMPRPVHSLHH